jgi:thiamine-phosphate pyrophosphorylase
VWEKSFPKSRKRTGNPLLLYYITDRAQFSGTEPRRREQLLVRVAEAVRAGIDYMQLREKDLPSRELEALARDVVRTARDTGADTRVLINSRADVALAAGADGVHLRSNDLSPMDVRGIWRTAGAESQPVVAVSCHTEEEVRAAKLAGADFVVFGPVFGKSAAPGVGLSRLSAACAHGIPVLALGGLNLENARSCVEAGAAGVAGIRLFQNGDLSATLAQLRNGSPSR